MENTVEVKKNAGLVTGNAPQRGFEAGLDKEDLIIPRAKLIQALSPEMTEGLEGVRVGAIINSLTKEVLPQEFIPIFMFKNYIRFNPRSKDDPNFNSDFEPGAVIWKSSDSEDPRVIEETRFGEEGEKPLAKFATGDMFSRKYRLSSQVETNHIASYAVLKVTATGMASSEDQALCEKLWNDFSSKAKDIQVHEEGTQEETTETRPY